MIISINCISYEIGVTKPDREIFDRMVLDSGIKPEETLFVDDGKNNIVVGQELGFHTYQPLNGEDWRGGSMKYSQNHRISIPLN